MTKRSKLSLDPGQRAKAPPPHGFEAPTETLPAGAAAAREAGRRRAGQEPGQDQGRARAADQGPARAQAPAAARVSSGWQAHPPGSGPAPQAAASDASTPESELAGAATLAAQVRSLAGRPLVRAVAVGLAAGLSLYLLRRRLF